MEQNVREKLFAAFKVACAATVAILFAMLLKLDSAVSAGTVAILTIQPTKRETISTAFRRILAFAFALLLSFACFEIFGYNMGGFIIFLIIFIFVSYFMKWTHSIAMCGVLISHFLRYEDMDLFSVGNETSIFLLGVSTGVIANMHLRKKADYIRVLKANTDVEFKTILKQMSEHILLKDESDYSYMDFDALRRSIRKAKNVADMNYNNQIRVEDVYDVDYIRMRDEQSRVLHEMYKMVRHLHTTPFTAHVISEFLEEMSHVDDKEDSAKLLIESFHELDQSMKSKPLPVTRSEFEDRAKLFILLRHIEEFLTLKLEFIEKYPLAEVKADNE